MRSLLACLAAAALASVALAVPRAWAQDPEERDGNDGESADFLAEPAPGAATSPRGGYFVIDLAPGAETRQALLVRNRDDEPVELALAAVDADTGPTGGAAYRRLDMPVEATGTWIALEHERVRLDPGEARTVWFDVTVPAAAESGDHLAGIAAWALDDVETVEEAPGTVVAIEQRRVIAVHITVPGPDEPVLRIGGLEPQAHAGGVRLLVHIANEGRGLTTGEGVLQVIDPAYERSFEFGTFVPRTAIAYPLPWVDGQAAEGTYHARVRIEHRRWTETWEGTFFIGEGITRELERLDAGDGADGAADPWLWLVAGAAGALAVGAAGWALQKRVRRRRRSARSSAVWHRRAPAASGRR